MIFYGKVVVSGVDVETGEDFSIERDVPGGGEETWLIPGLYRQTDFEAQRLATRKVENLAKRQAEERRKIARSQENRAVSDLKS